MEKQFEDARQSVAEIVEDYKRQYPSGQSKLNEENTKNWIDALFQSLGWTIRNDVVKEESAGKRKRVDYSFKIDGTTQFLLEAKKAGENLDDHITQAVAYGYQKSKRWVVLTNFEEIRIYNSQYWDQPDEVKRLFVPIKITEFVSRFEDLWILSKPGFKERLIEEVAKKYGKTKPKDPITRLLANDLDRWRGLLTKGINEHKRLNQLSTDSKEAQDWIDESVQRILDRILFIRVAEDRGIEEPVLEQALKEWRRDKQTPLIAHLKEKFRTMNGTYNSGLFHEHASEDLSIDDKLLEQVIEETYKNPQGLPYDFAAIDADILGSVYEQYLSVILKKTPARASLKKDEAHRKEQGIYYTPTYIVDYIVKNTLGEMLKNKKPEDADKIKVLDMACGSGSFLLKAFDTLDDYYRQKDKNYSQTKLDFETDAAKITRKTKILKNNIYGVDLDPKAVEIAQLNLLLKAAETKHRLPDLRENIKCGNSLIDDKQVAGERAFNWKEKFPEIMQNGGFDVIIGNPPYVRNRELKESEKQTMSANFETAEGQYDIYQLFFEKAIKLLKERGVIGFITSNKYATAEYGKKLRRFILNNCKILSIIDVSNIAVFRDAATYPYIMILQKTTKNENNPIKIVRVSNEAGIYTAKATILSQSDFNTTNSFSFNLTASNVELVKKIKANTVPLGEICEIREAIHTGNIRKKVLFDDKKNDSCKKVIGGRDVARYITQWGGKWILYDPRIIDRKTGEYGNFPDKKYFDKPKILIRDISLRLTATYDDAEFYCLNTLYSTILKENVREFDLKYLLGVINSNLMHYFFKSHFSGTHIQGGYLRFKPMFTKQLPIRVASIRQQQPLIRLVDEMLPINKRLSELGDKQTDESERLKKEISDTDCRIDGLVYDLYGLTAEERKIVEEAVK